MRGGRRLPPGRRIPDNCLPKRVNRLSQSCFYLAMNVNLETNRVSVFSQLSGICMWLYICRQAADAVRVQVSGRSMSIEALQMRHFA
jgi:hypothetical protein